MELKVRFEIPFSIGITIKNLKSLTSLDLSNCSEIHSIFLYINYFPVSLTYIDLSFTKLIDNDRWLDFRHLIRLKTLLLSNTGIVYFPRCPTSLRILDTSSNNMTDPCLVLAPENIQVISNLETLVIHGNRDIKLPRSIPFHILQF